MTREKKKKKNLTAAECSHEMIYCGVGVRWVGKVLCSKFNVGKSRCPKGKMHEDWLCGLCVRDKMLLWILYKIFVGQHTRIIS